MKEDAHRFDSPFPAPSPIAVPTLNLVLFLATVVTTTLAGILMETGPSLAASDGPAAFFQFLAQNPSRILTGLPFSLCLLLILGSHEMGHYIACRRYGVDASLPYFLPMLPFPFPLIGTMGAFIRIRARIPDRNALFDIGAAGPIAGFLVAIPILFIGLIESDVSALSQSQGTILLGEPLLLRWMFALIFPTLHAGEYLSMSSIALAGWIGLLATSLNLIPVGQLDGGHICYSVSRNFHAVVSRITAVAFLLFSLFWQNYILWAVLLLVLGRRHPAVGIEMAPLSRGRILLAWVCLGIFLLSFIPSPIRILD